MQSNASIVVQNQMKRELQQTADGSHTLFIPEMDEHYHSVNGAVQESRHVFIEAGLHHQAKKRISLFLRLVLGQGLNAFLTLLDAEENNRSVNYYSIELYPLGAELVRALNYGDVICPEKKEWFEALHVATWNEAVRITDRFTLHKNTGR